MVVNSIIDRIRSGKVFYIHLGIPCNSWSRARRNDGRGPGPLRDDDQFIMGLPHLSATDRDKVKLGNTLMQNSIRIIRACQQNNVLWTAENPMTSRLWKIRQFEQLKSCQFFRVDFCQYGLPWRKATFFLCDARLQPSFKVCFSHNGICSYSHKPYVILQGTKNGVFLTKLAEPYPWSVATALSKAVVSQAAQ